MPTSVAVLSMYRLRSRTRTTKSTSPASLSTPGLASRLGATSEYMSSAVRVPATSRALSSTVRSVWGAREGDAGAGPVPA